LRGRERFGLIWRFCGSETLIFHCARDKETEAKGSHWGDLTRDRTLDRTRLARPVSSTGRRAGRSARVCDRSVRSLAGPVHPVTHLGEQRGGKV
jgi:hypothetical protein